MTQGKEESLGALLNRAELAYQEQEKKEKKMITGNSKRLRAVATNAVLEAMILQKRQIVTDNDAGLVEIILLALEQVQANADAPVLSAPSAPAGQVQQQLEKLTNEHQTAAPATTAAPSPTQTSGA